MQLSAILLQALAITTASANTLAARDRDCQELYRQCMASGTPEVACSCDLATCTGEDNARTRDYCANATASIIRPIASATSTTSASMIVGTPGSQPSGQPPITAAEGSLPLGAPCSDTRQCAGGAQCYGTTAFTIRTCGSFNAACSSDAQCATNTCANGICSGFKPTTLSSVTRPSSTSASVSIITGTVGSQPSGQPPVTAPAGSLKLGDICSDSRQCAMGVECWASNAMLIRRCGNFNAACKSDDQCANDVTCNNGLCNGFPRSVISSIEATATATATATASPEKPKACRRKVQA